jgi:branched-chain amino acid transport system permease protein
VVLNRGQMIADGDPKTIQSNPAVIEAYIGRKRAGKTENNNQQGAGS